MADRIFGIKFNGRFVAVEETDQFADMTKYDYVVSDFVSNAYNGNISYGIKIVDVNGKGPIQINGWKLETFTFPGSWFGQSSHCYLVDSSGNRKDFCCENTPQWYSSNPVAMLRVSFEEFIEFAENNYSEEYNNIVEGKDLPWFKHSSKVEEFKENLAKTWNYVSNYLEVLSELEESDAQNKEGLISKLESAFRQNIANKVGVTIE